MGKFDFDRLVKNYSNASHMPIDYEIKGDEPVYNPGKQTIDFDFLVNQFFEMFQLYLDNMDEEKRDEFVERMFKSFFLRFNCEFKEDIILINLPHKDELQDFFIQKFEYVNEYINGFYHFDDEAYINKMFLEFNPSIDEVEVDSYVSRNIKTYSPRYANRYNINDIISQFSHDVINKKDVDLEDRYKYSKKLIMCFIYLSILTQFNKEYSLNVDGSVIDFRSVLQSNLSNIKVYENGELKPENPSLGDFIKRIDNITNAFAHSSGNFKYISDSNKIVLKNRMYFVAEVDIDKFLDGMENIYKVDLPKLLPSSYTGTLTDVFGNGSVKILLDLVNKFKNNDFANIDKNEIIFLMSYLQLCFNKEGLFDSEIVSQYGLVDCSKFKLDYGFDMDTVEAGTIDLFKNHHLIYTDSESSKKMNDFWSNYITDFNSKDDKKSGTLCDTSKMVYDTRNKVYIPSSEVITHLRNAFRHGRYKIDGDLIHFYDDKGKKDRYRPNQKYFYLSISLDDFLNFLSNNIINEVLYIDFSDLYDNDKPLDIFEAQRAYNKLFFYETEMAYSKNSFKNYMDILRTRFYDFELDDFIDVLMNNQLFSRYLADNMDKYDEFLEYELENGVKLVDYLKQRYDFDLNLSDDELDININLINGLVFEMRKLIEFERSNKKSFESVFFKYYFEYFFKKSNIFLNDYKLPKEYQDRIHKAKMDSEYLLGGIDYGKKYTRNFLLGLALFKHKDFNEFDRLSVLAANSLYLKNIYEEEEPLSFSYENVIKRTDDNDMFMESTANVVKKMRIKSIFRKGITAFKSLFATGLVSSSFVLCSLNGNNFLDPRDCILTASIIGLTAIYKYPDLMRKFSDGHKVIEARVSEKYIEANLENDDLFPRSIRSGKR